MQARLTTYMRRWHYVIIQYEFNDYVDPRGAQQLQPRMRLGEHVYGSLSDSTPAESHLISISAYICGCIMRRSRR